MNVYISQHIPYRELRAATHTHTHTYTHTQTQRILNLCVCECVYVCMFDLERLCILYVSVCVFAVVPSIIQGVFNIDRLIGMDDIRLQEVLRNSDSLFMLLYLILQADSQTDSQMLRWISCNSLT